LKTTYEQDSTAMAQIDVIIDNINTLLARLGLSEQMRD
jgi:hypothetical protein